VIFLLTYFFHLCALSCDEQLSHVDLQYAQTLKGKPRGPRTIHTGYLQPLLWSLQLARSLCHLWNVFTCMRVSVSALHRT
jgi:hypothetical protein